MSWDYLDDVFGKFRNHKTRFSALETEAKKLLTLFVNRKMKDKDFAEAFIKVRALFDELTTVDGHITIDQNTPLWLNMLFGFHFGEWLRYQRMKWYFEEHPEKLTDDYREQFMSIQEMGYDERFKGICEDLLNELNTSGRV